MIKTTARAILQDQEGINNVTFDVNFSKDHKDFVKITIGNKISVIKRDELWNFVFSIVTADKQQQMVPVIKQEMLQYVKQHTVELQKDMKKGEVVAVNCKVNVPELVVDAIKRDLEAEKSYPQPDVPTPYLDKESDM